MNKFLWGVDGVMLAGGRLDTTCDGGVCDRVLSLIPDNGSAAKESKSAWGTVFPKSSLRNTREYIRFASSARIQVSYCRQGDGQKIRTNSFGSGVLSVGYAF